MPVKHIYDMDGYKSLLETSKSKLVVIDFSAAWCGPCRFIGPIFEQLSEEKPDVEFAKVDVDESEEVTAECKISAMPTFQFYKGGAKVDELMGADEQGLREKLAKHQ